MRSIRKKQAGLTLIEVLLAVSISLIVMTAVTSRIKKDGEDVLTKAAGQQIEMVGNAANTYTALYYPKIISLANRPSPGSVDDPGPRYCTSNVTTIDSLPASICTIDVNTLRSAGLLPRNFSGRNAYGSTYNIYIRVIGTAPNYVVDGIVVTSQPFTVNGVNRYDLLGRAMQIAGDDSGMTRTLAKTVEGLNGSWRDADYPAVTHNGVAYPGVNQLGLLAQRFGYGSSAYAAFIRADGTTPFTGNIQAGGNDIVDVGTIVGKHGRFTGSSTSQEALSLGGTADNPSNADRTAFVASGGSLAIRNRNGVTLQDMDGNATTLNVGGIVSKTINANGDIVATGDINARDLVASRNISSVGNLSVGGAATVRGTLTAQSTIIAQGAITSNTSVTAPTLNGGGYTLTNQGLKLGTGTSPAWYYDSTAAAWRADTMIYSSTTIRGNVLRADTDVIAGRSLQVTSNAITPGTACTTSTESGTLRRSSTGSVLQCASGYWKELGVINTTTVTTDFVHGGAGQVEGIATCPANTRLVSGGVALIGNFNPGASSVDKRSDAPGGSFGSGNSWYGRTSMANPTGTTFRVFANCAL